MAEQCTARAKSTGQRCERPPVQPESLNRTVTDHVTDHVFVGVAGHPDDDECTYRSDGTDATYCGEPADAHEPFDQVQEDQ